MFEFFNIDFPAGLKELTGPTGDSRCLLGPLDKFSKKLLATKQDLEEKDYVLSQSLAQWEHNDAQALLTLKGVHVRSTFAHILSILNALQRNLASYTCIDSSQ